VILVLRILGKQQIGQLQPYELVIIIMISELATIPSEDLAIPILSGMIPIAVLMLLGLTISYVSLKSERARALFSGTPTIIVERGKILEWELARLRYNLTDLMEQLRAKNIFNIADVEFAILETNGQLSVIPKATKRAVTPEDLNITPKYEGLPLTLILDGKLNKENLIKAKMDLQDLQEKLKAFNISEIEDVLIATIDDQGTFYAQPKMSAY